MEAEILPENAQNSSTTDLRDTRFICNRLKDGSATVVLIYTEVYNLYQLWGGSQSYIPFIIDYSLIYIVFPVLLLMITIPESNALMCNVLMRMFRSLAPLPFGDNHRWPPTFTQLSALQFHFPWPWVCERLREQCKVIST